MKLPIEGHSIALSSLGFALELSISEGFVLQVEGHVDIEAGETAFSFTPSPDVESVSEIARALSGTIQSSRVRSGTLSMTLNSGTVLTVHPDPDFEAWNITGPDGYRIVCMPGGELATWAAE